MTYLQYAIIDELMKVAKELAATPSIISLACIPQKPFVRTTLLGASTIEQPESKKCSQGFMGSENDFITTLSFFELPPVVFLGTTT